MSEKLSLPSEILGLVAEHIGADSRKSDLLNLALSSRACRVEAQRALFQVMDEHPNGRSDENITAAIQTHNLFLDSIMSNPDRLGPLVRCYACIDLATAPAASEFHPESGFDRKDERLSDSRIREARMRMWNKLFHALPLLTGLAHLTFVPNNQRENTNCAAILNRCQFSLRSLFWGDPHDLPVLAAEFFPRQPRLRSFGLYGDWWVPASSASNVPMDVLPCLKRLKGGTNTILSFLPRTNIESISCDWDTLDMSRALRVGPELARARYLCMAGTEGLNLILPYLGSVETLCLKTRRRDWDPDSCKFNLMTSLRVLILPWRGVRGNPRYDDEYTPAWLRDIVQIVKAAFKACPMLQLVYVEDFLTTFRYFPCKHVDGQITVTDHIPISEVFKLFDPWMPYTITQPDEVDKYL